MFPINWNKCYEWKVWGGTEWAGWVGGRQERPLHVHHIARPMDFSCGVSPKGHFVHRNLMFHSRCGGNMWYLSLSPNSLALGGQKLEGWWMGGGGCGEGTFSPTTHNVLSQNTTICKDCFPQLITVHISVLWRENHFRFERTSQTEVLFHGVNWLPSRLWGKLSLWSKRTTG